MFLDPPTYCAPELEKFSADDLPVFPRAIFHVMRTERALAKLGSLLYLPC